MTDKGKYTIDILDVALDVIECLMLSGGKPLRASEIANQLTINRTRVFRILKTLEERGYSAFNPDTQGFRLGLKFLEINKEVLKGFNLRKEVEPILVDLAISTISRFPRYKAASGTILKSNFTFSAPIAC